MNVFGHWEWIFISLSVTMTFLSSMVVLYLHDQQTYHNETLYDMGFLYLFPLIPWEFIVFFEPVVWCYGLTMNIIFWLSDSDIDKKILIWKRYLRGMAIMYGVRALTIGVTIQPSPCGKQGMFYGDNMYSGHTIFLTSARLLAVCQKNSYSREFEPESIAIQAAVVLMFMLFRFSIIAGYLTLCVIITTSIVLRSLLTFYRVSYTTWCFLICLIISFRMHYTADIIVGLIISYLYNQCLFYQDEYYKLSGPESLDV